MSGEEFILHENATLPNLRRKTPIQTAKILHSGARKQTRDNPQPVDLGVVCLQELGLEVGEQLQKRAS